MTENITYNHRGIRTSPQPSTLIGGVAAAEHVGDIGITQGNQQHTRHTTELELVKEATENDEGLPLKKRGGGGDDRNEGRPQHFSPIPPPLFFSVLPQHKTQ